MIPFTKIASTTFVKFFNKKRIKEMPQKIFIGRKKELGKLSLLLDKKSASLAVVRGRRRIGKSYLVKEFGRQCVQNVSKPCRFLSFSGLPPTDQTTAESQREEFAKQLARNLNLPELKARDWGDLFLFLAPSWEA